MHQPQEILFKVITDIRLLELLAECTDDITPLMFNDICNYHPEQQLSIAAQCTKTDKWNTEFCNDRDIVVYLVNRGKLPEGDYLIKIT